MHNRGTETTDYPNEDGIGGECLQIIYVLNHRETGTQGESIDSGIHQKTDFSAADQVN